MTLFELKDGRLGPASPGRPADDGATGWALAAVRHQLTEILGWPVLPISWSRIEGGDALTALDPIGQVIHLEVLRTLDASALLAAMARQAEASALNRTELSALYPGGAGIFRRDWNAFRASAPEGARPGPRLVIVTAFLAAEVRAGAALLAGSGVEIRVLDVRMVGDGNGQERILVGVEPLRTAGAGGSAGNAGSIGSVGNMGSAGNVGGAPVEAGGRHGTGPVAEPSPRQMPDTTVMAPATPSWSGAPDGPTGTGVLPAMTGSGPWTPDGSTPPGGSPIGPAAPGAPGGPGAPGAPGGPGGPVGLSGPGGPGGPGGLGGPGAPVTQLATVPVRRASGLVSPSHVIRMPAGATSPVLSPSSSASVASPSPAAPPPPPPALPSEASPHAAPGDLPTAPYSVASPPRGPSMPAFSPSAAPSSIAPPRTTTPSRPLTPPRPMAQVAPPAPMSAPPAMGSSPAPAAPSPIERPETSFAPSVVPPRVPTSSRSATPSRPLTPARPMPPVEWASSSPAVASSPATASLTERFAPSFAPSVVPPRVPTSSRSATPSRPLTPARPMPPVVEPSAVTSSPSPEGSLPSELSAASFALTMPMTTSSASSAAVPSVSPTPPSASSAAASPASSLPSAPSIPPSVSSAAASILPSAPSALPSALSPAPPTRVGAFSDHGGAPAPTGRQAVSWLDERHESRALVEDLRGPHAVVDNVDSRDSIERRASHRSAAPVLGARPTVAPGAPAARALAVVASRVETPAALVWRSARRGINHEAVLSADGYLTLADGRRFTDPSRAADEAQHTQDTDGWRVWRLGPGGPSLGEILQSESQAPAEPRPQAESRRAQAEPRTRAELRARDQYRDRDRIGA